MSRSTLSDGFFHAFFWCFALFFVTLSPNHDHETMNLTRIVTLAITILSVVGGFARPQLHDLDIRVVLHHNGDANITETRKMTIDDEGTECYIGLDNMGDMKVYGLSVKDESGNKYEDIGDWDVDRSRSWKEGKCGIIYKRNNGYELCWGLGDSGERTYVASYTIEGFVQRHPDADAFRHIFLGSDVSQKPEHAKITIVAADPKVEFSPDSCGIWGFRFHGELTFEDGQIVVETTEPMTDGSGLYVMAGFAPGLFEPTITQSVTFEQKREEAFEGSDYNEKDENSDLDDTLDAIIGFLAFLFVTVLPGGLWFYTTYWHRIAAWRARRKVQKNLTWYSGIPMKGNLQNANDLLNAYSSAKNPDYKNLISASVLRLINIGAFTVQPRMTEKGAMEQRFVVREELPAYNDQPLYLRKLHAIFKLAAGDDMVLDPKELKNFMKDKANKTVTESFVNALRTTRSLSYYKTHQDDVLQVFGLKKYLEDFTLLDERHLSEVNLWKNYMVYATLFGIAEQVIKDMKKINPDFFKMDELAAQMSDTVVLPILINNVNWGTQHVINRIASTSSSHTYFGGSGTSFRSGGGGGFSSWGGGGGGFSGGGGGGVR